MCSFRVKPLYAASLCSFCAASVRSLCVQLLCAASLCSFHCAASVCSLCAACVCSPCAASVHGLPCAGRGLCAWPFYSILSALLCLVLPHLLSLSKGFSRCPLLTSRSWDQKPQGGVSAEGQAGRWAPGLSPGCRTIRWACVFLGCGVSAGDCPLLACDHGAWPPQTPLGPCLRGRRGRQ